MQVPYCVVKGKSRLGSAVGKKTATALAIVNVNKEDQATFASLTTAIRENYNDKHDDLRRQWGGARLGVKSQHSLKAKRKRSQKDITKA